MLFSLYPVKRCAGTSLAGNGQDPSCVSPLAREHMPALIPLTRGTEALPAAETLGRCSFYLSRLFAGMRTQTGDAAIPATLSPGALPHALQAGQKR